MNHMVTGQLQVQSEAEVAKGLVMVSVWQLSVFPIYYNFLCVQGMATWCGVYN